MTGLDFDRYSTLTFDCYGTLVDWENSVLTPLRAIVDRSSATPSDLEIRERFTTLDSDPTSQPYRSYVDVLAAVTRSFAQGYGVTASDEDIAAVIEAVADSPSYAETLQLLPRWANDRALVVISNCDDVLIERTLAGIPVSFQAVITSEQARAYKADIQIFRLALECIATSGNSVLHVAEWLAESTPARALGMGSVWVKRTDWAHVGGTDDADVTVATLSELDALMYR